MLEVRGVCWGEKGVEHGGVLGVRRKRRGHNRGERLQQQGWGERGHETGVSEQAVGEVRGVKQRGDARVEGYEITPRSRRRWFTKNLG